MLLYKMQTFQSKGLPQCSHCGGLAQQGSKVQGKEIHQSQVHCSKWHWNCWNRWKHWYEQWINTQKKLFSPTILNPKFVFLMQCQPKSQKCHQKSVAKTAHGSQGMTHICIREFWWRGCILDVQTWLETHWFSWIFGVGHVRNVHDRQFRLIRKLFG